VIALPATHCNPHDGDYLLLDGAVYQLWPGWLVWACVWEYRLAAWALDVLGVWLTLELARGQGWRVGSGTVEMRRAA
jgi:hypothetical protein